MPPKPRVNGNFVAKLGRLYKLACTHGLSLAGRALNGNTLPRVAGWTSGPCGRTLLFSNARVEWSGPNVFERLTEQARRSIFFARYEATHYSSSFIETEHLLLGILREDKPLSSFLQRRGASVDEIRRKLEERISAPGRK